MADPKQLVKLAERVAELARELGIETALIGAAALAVHNYERSTKDLDLGTNVDPVLYLSKLELAVKALGLHTALRLPDDEDPIGGVLDVSDRVDEDGDLIDPIQIVNFYNPYRPRRTPGADAVKRAVVIGGGSTLRCVRLPDLIALKLDAGSLRDDADVVELLFRNPGVDLEEVRATCEPYGSGARLEELIAAALASR